MVKCLLPLYPIRCNHPYLLSTGQHLAEKKVNIPLYILAFIGKVKEEIF